VTDTASTTSADPGLIKHRKGRHLTVCVDPQEPIEASRSYFHELSLIHRPLPELDCDQVDTRVSFLGHTLSRPFFISCMTGGAEASVRTNRNLVRAAQQTGIPVGLGSMRVLLRDPDLLPHFQLKGLAPDVPIWANLSVTQLADTPALELVEWLKRLEVQALVLHCNVGQEQFQPQGDRHFRGMLEAVRKLCAASSVPIIVKETGFGLGPMDVSALQEAGVAAVDLAGAGGTNWVLVESQSHPEVNPTVAREFRDWGNPTALVLAALPQSSLPVLASGGVRSGLDIAKSLALGADLAGLALPFVQADHQAGLAGVLQCIENLTLSLKTVMLMTGSRTTTDLSRAGLIMTEDFITQVRQYQRNGDWRSLLHGT
jgi:isopentenyl-diphosphate delta-isomerase type 2